MRWMMTTGVPRLSPNAASCWGMPARLTTSTTSCVRRTRWRAAGSLATELAAMRRLQEVSSRLVQAGDTIR